MSDYRRYFVPGGTHFFTVVSYGRRPILTTDLGRRCLRNAIVEIRKQLPFDMIAICLLREHVHAVWALPRGDADYSTRWKRIKHEFSTNWIGNGGSEVAVTEAERTEGRRGIWQPRFWEHTVRDESDLERCVDYVHWNPRKHDLVRRVQDWPYSSFHRFVSEGHYDMNWGGTKPSSIADVDSDWGEPM